MEGAVKPVLLGQQLLTGDELVRYPNSVIPWAVDGLVAERDLVILSGEGGIGKTYVMQELAIALSRGRSLFNTYPVKRPYRVLYMDCEMSDWATIHRFQRMLKAEDNLDGMQNLFVIPGASFTIEDGPSRGELQRLIEYHKIEWVMIDSALRTTRGDENDSQTPNRILKFTRDCRSRFGVGFVYIHHWRKKSREAFAADDDKGQILRGSAGWRDAIDAHIAMTKRTRDGENMIWTVPEKTRHADKPCKPFLLKWQKTEPDNEESPFKVVTATDTDEQGRDDLLALIQSRSEEGIGISEAATILNVERTTIFRHYKRLQSAGIITVSGETNQRRLTIVSPEEDTTTNGSFSKQDPNM